MSFISMASINLPAPPEDLFTELSTEESLRAMIRLSPSTASIEVIHRDEVLLHDDLTYTPVSSATTLQVKESDESVTRLHFKLIERVSFMGFPLSVTVMGTQIASPRKHLHLYESSANDGQVTIHKLRKFLPTTAPRESGDAAQAWTRIEESITGHTSRWMSAFVGRECRRAHTAHVKRYPELISESQ